MKQYPKISIIIPLFVKTPYFLETIEECLKLNYPNFEVIIGIDRKVKLEVGDKRVRIIKTGEIRTGPAEKRDSAIRQAKGELIAFLDDDSYPARDWLTQAVKILAQAKVSTVCGPGLTPPTDTFSQKITGAVLSSKFGSGPYMYRFARETPRFVDDYPAYNMIVEKKTLLKVGGFGTKFYGGEDTALCIKLINAGEKIYYHPDIIVYHHRRKFPSEYGKQVGNVGLHRGYFVKAYPQTSLRISYFAPAIFILLALTWLMLVLFSNQLRIPVFSLLLFFYIVIFMDGLNKQPVYISLVLPFAVIYNYLCYGLQFLKGLLFVRKLER